MEHLPDVLDAAGKLGSPWSEILTGGVAIAFIAASIYGYARRSPPAPTPPPSGGSQDLLVAVGQLDGRLRELERGHDRILDALARINDSVDRGANRIETAVARTR